MTTSMKKRRQNLNRPPIPDYLQWSIERNIGKPPLWKFPPLEPTPEGLRFEKLDFENDQIFLETFQNDPSEWVDERFKNADLLYEYVCTLRFDLQFSWKHGGCDWLVFTSDDECVGVLHAFEFSRERFGFNNRKCAVGFAFAEKFRGSEIPKLAVQHFENYLFQKLDRLILVAWVDFNNSRCCRFLEKLGWEDWTLDYRVPDMDFGGDRFVPEERFFEKYRSARTRTRVCQRRAEWFAKNPSRFSGWLKNVDGSWSSPSKI